MYRIVQKLKRLKRPLRALNAAHYSDLEGQLKAKREELNTLLNDIQSHLFDDILINREKDLLGQLTTLQGSILKDLKQRAKTKWINFGDEGTKFFHSFIKQCKSSSAIFSLVTDDGRTLDSRAAIEEYAIHYFKNLLQEGSSVTPINPDICKLAGMISDAQKANLLRHVSDIEIKNALFSIPDSKASGPDGFNSAFFKRSWNIISTDLCAAVREVFENGKLLREVNVTTLHLIPKNT